MSSCPRCGESLDTRPALSRVDNTTSICEQCGIEEALFQATIDSRGGPTVLPPLDQKVFQ